MIEVIQKKNRILATGQRMVEIIEGDFFFCPVVDGKEYTHCAETEDVAMLIGLAIKYDGLNSQFPKMACRMLGIKSNWAE